MHRNLLLVLSVFTSLVCKAQNFGFKLENGRTKVIIPVEILNNMIVVPVILNDQIPLKFILDTGVRTTILTRKTYSDILGLTYSKKYTLSGPGGNKLVNAFVTNDVNLDLPGVHGIGLSMFVLEKDYLQLRNFLGTEVHGILGYELFSRFIIQMDYKRKRLTLMLPERFKKRKRYQTLPIVVQDTKPFIMTTIKMSDTTPIQTKLLMDTGASHGLILEPESHELIRVPENNIESIIGRGLSGVIMGKIGRISSLELGKYKIRNIIANFPDLNSYTDTLFRKSNIERNGALGGEILSHFNLIFNFSEEEIYIKKNSSFKGNFNYVMSGITVKAIGASLRNYEITELRTDSPGERVGLKVGDQILAVSGNPVYRMNLNEINGYFNAKAGRRVSVEVEREGKRIRFKFRLENQI